jgi:hypothetical protein
LTISSLATLRLQCGQTKWRCAVLIRWAKLRRQLVHSKPKK